MFPDAPDLLSPAEAVAKMPTYVPTDTQELQALHTQFMQALHRCGFYKGMTEDLKVEFQVAVNRLGVRMNNSRVEDLRTWLAKVLALKYSKQELPSQH